MAVSVEVLKVSASSNPKMVAGAIAAVLRSNKSNVELEVIGAGALNPAIKAIIIARGYVAPNGIDLIVIPAFVQIEVNNEIKTAIKLIIERR